MTRTRQYPVISFWPFSSYGHDRAAVTLSNDLKVDLIFIAGAFQEASSIILGDVDKCEITNSIRPKYQPIDVEILRRSIEFHIPEVDDDIAPLLKWMEDTSIIPVWRRALEQLFIDYGCFAKDDAATQTFMRRLILFCENILGARNRAVEVFNLIEDGLDRLSLFALRYALREKFLALSRFSSFQIRLPNKRVWEVNAIAYVLHQIPRRNLVEGEQNKSLKPSISTLLALSSIAFVLSTIPLGFAWKFSTNASGTRSDPDFYLLMQSSTMTAFGICIGYYPVTGQPVSAAKRWAQVLGMTGLLCCLSAPPMYLYIATMWSALVSYIAAIVQAYMVLQLTIVADFPANHLKKE